MRRVVTAVQQLHWLYQEGHRLTYGRPYRWWTVPFSNQFIALAEYRLQRAAYIALGRWFQLAKVVSAPIRFLFRPWLSPFEIDYRADIGPGLHISHPNLGGTIFQHLRAGKNLFLVGGSIIGSKHPRTTADGKIVIGDDVTLGAFAMVLGELNIGNNCTIGANSVLTVSIDNGVTATGIPATSRPSRTHNAAVGPYRC